MSEDRLDARIMLQDHREIIPDTKTIIDHFIGGVDGRRRIDLSLSLSLKLMLVLRLL